jgi:hypothetical protein
MRRNRPKLPEPRFTYTSPSVEDIVLTLDRRGKNGLSCDRVDALIPSLWLSGKYGGARNELLMGKACSGNRACVVCSGANQFEPAIYRHELPAAASQSPAFAPDAPLPDLGSLPSPASTTKSKVKRALDRLTPNCADVVYHSCWGPYTKRQKSYANGEPYA